METFRLGGERRAAAGGSRKSARPALASRPAAARAALPAKSASEDEEWEEF